MSKLQFQNENTTGGPFEGICGSPPRKRPISRRLVAALKEDRLIYPRRGARSGDKPPILKARRTGRRSAWYLIRLSFVCLSLFSQCVAQTQPESQETPPSQNPPPQQESPSEKPSNWQWSFSIRNRTGFRTEQPRVLQMSRTTFDVKGIYKINDDWRMTLEGRAHFDPVNRLGYPKNLWVDPRQALLDGKVKKFDLKLGLQQVVWGQADGLRVLDVINPLDYREFILEDFIDSRRPLWLARADAPLGKGALQLIWVPYFAPGRLPASDNEFGLGESFGLGLVGSTLILPQVNVRAEKAERPGYRLNSSQLGARYSQSVGKWDLSANYFYGWEDTPTNYLSGIEPGAVGQRDECETRGFPESAGVPVCLPSGNAALWEVTLLDGGRRGGLRSREQTLVFHPRFDRKEVFGGTAATNFGSVVLRMEAGWNRNKPTAVKTNTLTGIENYGQFSGVVGLDWSAKTWLWISGQYFQTFASAPQEKLALPRYSHLASIYFRTNFLRETIRPELFVLTGLNQREYLIRPKITKTFGDHWSVGVGADFFGGKPTNIFGYFDSRDRVVIELKWLK
jgi:hypothetical protein